MDANKMDAAAAPADPSRLDVASTARPYAVDPNAVQRASMRSLTTIAAPMPVLMEDENGYMPKPPMLGGGGGGGGFDNLSRSSLSRPSSVSPSFSLHSASGSTVPAIEWADEESRKKYLDNVSTYHRQRPTTVYSFALLEPGALALADSNNNSSGDVSGISMAGLKQEKQPQQQGGAVPLSAVMAAEEGRVMPDGRKKRDYFFKHFGWWRALMMVLMLAAVGVGLGLGLHYGLMNHP